MSIYRLGFLTLAFIAMSACTPSQPEIVRPLGATTYPPTQYVDFLERAPQRAYKEIAVIDTPSEPGALRSQVLAQIRTRAQELGADAVILQDLSRPSPVVTRLNPVTGNYETTGGQPIPVFKGVAIKYQ
jgi:hypothetical protein